MKFTPIAGYNNYLKNNASFSVDSNVDFENVLNKQTEALSQNPVKLQSGIEMNMNFDDLMTQATSSVESAHKGVTGESAGDLINSFASSFKGGLNAVGQKEDAANKAQEALAMGEDISVHDVMIAAEKSALSMQMALQVRNKILTAYNEINNIRV